MTQIRYKILSIWKLMDILTTTYCSCINMAWDTSVHGNSFCTWPSMIGVFPSISMITSLEVAAIMATETENTQGIQIFGAILFSRHWQRQLSHSVRSLTSCGPRCFRGAYVRVTSVLFQRAYSALANNRFPTKGPVVYHFQHYGRSVHLFFG